MKTTELYIEQVFIGFLVIAVALLPWLPDWWDKLDSIDATVGLAGGSLALGLAFWLGIPFDRFADTLTERLERHNRLRFALGRARGSPVPKDLNEHELETDIYPEDRLRVAGLRDKDAAVSWIDYHRSRIRLTRALALYGPAMTVALTLGVARGLEPSGPFHNSLWLGGIAAAYVLWAALATVGKKLPRTDDPELRNYAKKWKFADAKLETFEKSPSHDLSVWLSEWPILLVPVALLGLALGLGFNLGKTEVLAAAGAGAALTAISAWSWWRVSYTYRSYLHDLVRYQ